MFDKFRLKAALVEYKKRFVQTQWPDEKYKWEAVQCFQVNWDVNSDDFAGMLTKALSQTGNLLASVNNFPAKMITKFAEIAQEEVRAMFIELFDESKDVYERILQHLKRWLGGDYFSYWTGLDAKEEADWKIELRALAEETNHTERLKKETEFITKNNPFLQDTANGIF